MLDLFSWVGPWPKVQFLVPARAMDGINGNPLGPICQNEGTIRQKPGPMRQNQGPTRPNKGLIRQNHLAHIVLQLSQVVET